MPQIILTTITHSKSRSTSTTITFTWAIIFHVTKYYSSLTTAASLILFFVLLPEYYASLTKTIPGQLPLYQLEQLESRTWAAEVRFRGFPWLHGYWDRKAVLRWSSADNPEQLRWSHKRPSILITTLPRRPIWADHHHGSRSRLEPFQPTKWKLARHCLISYMQYSASRPKNKNKQAAVFD